MGEIPGPITFRAGDTPEGEAITPEMPPAKRQPKTKEPWTSERAAEMEGILAGFLTNGLGVRTPNIKRYSNQEFEIYQIFVGRGGDDINAYYLRYNDGEEALEAWSALPGRTFPVGLEQRISTALPTATHETLTRPTGFATSLHSFGVHRWIVPEQDLLELATQPRS